VISPVRVGRGSPLCAGSRSARYRAMRAASTGSASGSAFGSGFRLAPCWVASNGGMLIPAYFHRGVGHGRRRPLVKHFRRQH
jgi:hypothetical protein